LWLSGGSIQPQERERMGGAGEYRMLLPLPQAAPEAPTQQDTLKARLGLPISVPTRMALSLIKQQPWRYAGVCFATRTQNGVPPEWQPELAPYFCVNFNQPVMSEEHQNSLSAALNRKITPEEWEALDRLDAREAQQALRWSINEDLPCPVRRDDERWREWLAAFRGASYHGARLLAILRRDLHPASLPLSLIKIVAPTLSEAAIAFLAECMQDNAAHASTEVIEELALKGYLNDSALPPLRSLTPHLAASSLIADQALLRLEHLGVDRTAAGFLLDMKPADGAVFLRRTAFLPSVKIAHDNGVPAPRRNVIALLNNADEIKDLWALEGLSDIYGGWAGSVFEMADAGKLPAPQSLTLSEMRAVVELRRRLEGNDWEYLDVIAKLCSVARYDEAVAFFEDVRPILSSILSAGAMQILTARFGLGAPAGSVPFGDLARLSACGLARPEDLIPAVDGSDLAECARAWQETSPIADLIENVSDDLPETPPAYPPHWRIALGNSLSIFRLKKWAQKVQPAQSNAVLSWVARLYDLDLRALQAFRGEEAMPESRERTELLLPWIELFLVSETRARRLRGLGNTAQSGISRGDEKFALRLAHAILPDENEQAIEFAVYGLAGLGPMPLLDMVPADLIIALLPSVDVQALIDRLFIGEETLLSADKSLGASIGEQLRQRQIACPERGYTTAQRSRHMLLAAAISIAPGWERLSPDEAQRRQFAQALLRRLELRNDPPVS
jgi:hypothetical protein